MELGKKIKLLRKELGFTLADISKKTGMAQSTLSRIERGSRTGTIKTHLKLSKAFGIRISELYTGLEGKSKEEISAIGTASKDIEDFRYNEKAFTISLARDLSKKKMKPELLIIAPSHTVKERGESLGREKFIFCYEGLIEVVINKTSYRLKKGGSLYFNSALSQSFKNIGKITAKCVVVSNIP